MAAASINGSSTSGQKSPSHSSQQDAAVMSTGSFIESARVMWNFFFNKPAGTVPTGEIPVRKMSREQLLAAPDNTVFRLGHSTVLLKLQNAFWLTDPVFSDRASPIPFAGPLRFHKPPISIEELPPIKGVIISHDHYDHLDRRSIVALAKKTEYFMTPPGVGDIIAEWGVPSAKIRQLDWWQSIKVGGVLFAATPSRHFSGRGLFGRNKTQWGSWVILAPDFRIFFSGDSGYFSGFKRIGDEYGPFDLTMIEAGAYNANWAGVHMTPEETIQAHLDLRGKRLLPIHNGTFDLAMHGWREPFDRLAALAQARYVEVAFPVMGEPVLQHETGPYRHWWASVDAPHAGTSALLPEPDAVHGQR
ncbi:MBL fold metallo-hydrolase [Geomonas oryzae]|uniref:MBL fold metallo-hydrolase n=1 Tax=Geomonas oryzae TaxID=2364273 RepID=UPI0018E09C39|nr:MBL fold metallo-hydrolase [Geomonas oryzae]